MFDLEPIYISWLTLRPESELLSNKWIVWGDTWADKKGKESLLKGTPGQRTAGQENSGELLYTWLAVSGFIIRLVSELSLANHSDTGCFHSTNTTQGGLPARRILEVGGTRGLEFPLLFDISLILLVGSSLLFPHSLPGLPVKDNSLKGRCPCPGWAVSASASLTKGSPAPTL